MPGNSEGSLLLPSPQPRLHKAKKTEVSSQRITYYVNFNSACVILEMLVEILLIQYRVQAFVSPPSAKHLHFPHHQSIAPSSTALQPLPQPASSPPTLDQQPALSPPTLGQEPHDHINSAEESGFLSDHDYITYL